MADDIIDLPEFLERVQDDKELLLELLDIFQEDYSQKRELLKQAVDGNDAEEVRNLAHSLKGATGNISAKSLRDIFMQLEENGKENKLDGSSDLLSELDNQYAILSERINQLKQELSA